MTNAYRPLFLIPLIAACGGAPEVATSAATIEYVPTPTPIWYTIDAVGVLTFDGTLTDDVVTVAYLGRTDLQLGWNGDTHTIARTGITSIRFDGNDGDDSFTNGTAIPCEVDGGDGDDVLIGGSGDDRLAGDAGADSIGGNGGDDRIYGGPGSDLIDGGSGNDLIVTVGGGNDTVVGGPQWDNFWVDDTDALSDTSPSEESLGYVHRIAAFMPLSYDGGATSIPVSKEPNVGDLPDPLPLLGPFPSKTDFAGQPLFDVGGPSEEDIFQGVATNDCYFVAMLSALAYQQPAEIRRLVVDLGDGTYAVRFFREGAAVYVRVDGQLWTDASASPVHAGLGQGGAIWVPIVEKAYAFFRKEKGSYASIAGGDSTAEGHLGMVSIENEIQDGISPLTTQIWFALGQPAWPTGDTIHTSVVDLLEWIDARLAAGDPLYTGAISGVSDASSISVENPDTYRRGQHIFMIRAVERDAAGNPTGLVLRNPYGWDLTITDFVRLHFCIGRAYRLVH